MPLKFAKKVFGKIPLLVVCVLMGCQPSTPVAIPSPGIPDLTIPAGSIIVEKPDLGFPNTVLYKFDNKAGWDTVVSHIEAQLLANGFALETSNSLESGNQQSYLSNDRLILVLLIQIEITKEMKMNIIGNLVEFNIAIHKLDEPFPEDEKGDK